ncbi:MAG: PAC2 family protein [Candidatus Woesearchaeota archaeon]
MTWKINKVSSPKIKNPILIEGLPGVGNVGKIATDFMIDSLGAKKLFEITSYNLPHCVFVNENNLVELPTIEVFYKNFKNHTLLLLAGDIQPLDEPSCYEFCDQILDMIEGFKGKKEVITLGGIALERNPKQPKVYATANNQKIRKKYAGRIMNNSIFGVVGPIIGVSGLLVGLAGKRNIPAVSFLAETYGHPTHLGIRSAKEILRLLNQNLKLNLDLSELDAEIVDMEREEGKLKRVGRLKKATSASKDFNYIG